jgi:hypothetical protein
MSGLLAGCGLAQEARGDVTLIPDVRLRDYLDLNINLDSFKEIERKVREEK